MKTVLSISLWGCLGLSMASHAAPKPYTLAFAANPPFSMTDNGRPQGIAINIISFSDTALAMFFSRCTKGTLSWIYNLY